MKLNDAQRTICLVSCILFAIAGMYFMEDDHALSSVITFAFSGLGLFAFLSGDYKNYLTKIYKISAFLLEQSKKKSIVKSLPNWVFIIAAPIIIWIAFCILAAALEVHSRNQMEERRRGEQIANEKERLVISEDARKVAKNIQIMDSNIGGDTETEATIHFTVKNNNDFPIENIDAEMYFFSQDDRLLGTKKRRLEFQPRPLGPGDAIKVTESFPAAIASYPEAILAKTKITIEQASPDFPTGFTVEEIQEFDGTSSFYKTEQGKKYLARWRSQQQI